MLPVAQAAPAKAAHLSDVSHYRLSITVSQSKGQHWAEIEPGITAEPDSKSAQVYPVTVKLPSSVTVSAAALQRMWHVKLKLKMSCSIGSICKWSCAGVGSMQLTIDEAVIADGNRTGSTLTHVGAVGSARSLAAGGVT